MSRIRKYTPLFFAAAAAPALFLAGPVLSKDSPERSGTFNGTLTPLNDSGISGSFTIEQRGQGQITVNIQATGLEASNGPHVAHIHGKQGNQNATCPTMAQDRADDNDGFIEVAEGRNTYGPIIVPLGDVDPDNDGVVNYSMTFKLNKDSTFADGKDKDDLLPLELREIVIHGLTLQDGDGANGGEADGTAGYKVILPVACGEIQM